MNKNLLEFIKSLTRSNNLVHKAISNSIINNLNSFPNISITVLASEANVSKSTIVSFCKMLNLSGFKELLYSIHDEKEFNKTIVEKKNFPVKEYEILKKYNFIIKNCMDFAFNENIESIISLSNIIKKSHKIFLFAKGANLDVIRIFHNYLIKIGIDVVYSSDIDVQMHYSKFIEKNDTLIIFSYSFQDRWIQNILDNDNKCKKVLFTGNKNKNLNDQFDEILYAKENEEILLNQKNVRFQFLLLVNEVILLLNNNTLK